MDEKKSAEEKKFPGATFFLTMGVKFSGRLERERERVWVRGRGRESEGEESGKERITERQREGERGDEKETMLKIQ